MENIAQHGWLSDHRGWEDVTSALCGGLILLSPAIGETTTAIAVNAGIFGIFIAILAVLQLMTLQNWEELLELVCGAWMVASPFVFQYGGSLRLIHIVLGAVVVLLAILELWQDRNRLLAA